MSPYGLTDWPGVVDLLGSDGPTDVIRRVRQAEAGISAGPEAPVPDDATVAHCVWGTGRGSSENRPSLLA